MISSHRSSFPLLLQICTVIALKSTALVFAQDNGIPTSRASEFTQKYSAKTSSEFRTYENKKTKQAEISFNPKTQHLFFNEVTKKFEAVIREKPSPDGAQADTSYNGTKTSNDSAGKTLKTEMTYNPVTKKFEKTIVEGKAVRPQADPVFQTEKMADYSARYRSGMATQGAYQENSKPENSGSITEILTRAYNAGAGPKFSIPLSSGRASSDDKLDPNNPHLRAPVYPK